MHPEKDITAHAELDAIRNAGEAMFDAKNKKMRGLLFIARWNRAQCVQVVFYLQKIQRVVWLLNDDLGFGGYKKDKKML